MRDAATKSKARLDRGSLRAPTLAFALALAGLGCSEEGGEIADSDSAGENHPTGGEALPDGDDPAGATLPFLPGRAAGNESRESGPAGAGAGEGDPDTLGQTARSLSEEGYLGVVVAREALDIAAPQTGEIAEIPVRIGDTVSAGDPVAVLDKTPLREELEKMRAELAGARADLRSARADVEEARDRLERRERLEENVAEEELEEARYRARQASAARDRAGAEVRRREADVSELRRRLEDATVETPLPGRISLRYRDPGARIEAGGPIVRILAVEEPWIRFAVPPEEAPALEVEDELSTDVESTDETVTSIVRQIGPEVDPHAQMILVEAELDAPADLASEIRSGHEVRVFP